LKEYLRGDCCMQDTQDPLQSEEYQLALARTRQAVATHKAVDFMQVGSQARCVMPFLM
jgi:hypothetical protein